MKRVCPKPIPWNRAFESLTRHATAYVCTPPLPPIPLILAGWAHSNDQDKMSRWADTVAWAHANGCGQIVDKIPDQDFYYVENPSANSIAPLGGPMYRPWDSEPKPRPLSDAIKHCLEILLSDWFEVAGDELGRVTRPLAFSGRKGRRLIVQANPDSQPAWGNWFHLSNVESERRAFTRFRAAINKAIAPHEIDHVDFTTSRLDTKRRLKITRELIEKKLSELLVIDEAGWEAAADWIASRVYEFENIEITHYDSPDSFSVALMDRLYRSDLQRQFPGGVESLNDFEVAEELVWRLVPSGYIFGR
jgi:hypothetical protein